MEHGIFGTQAFESPFTVAQRRRAWYGPFSPHMLAQTATAAGTGLGCAGCPQRQRQGMGAVSAAQATTMTRYLLPMLVGAGIGALATRGRVAGRGLANRRVKRALAGAAAGLVLGMLDPGGYLTDIGARAGQAAGLSGVWLRPWSPAYPKRFADAMVL